jgi:hypothetical protein
MAAAQEFDPKREQIVSISQSSMVFHPASSLLVSLPAQHYQYSGPSKEYRDPPRP